MEMASSDGAQIEPVNGDVPPSTGRKGKRNLVSDDDLQPTPKKTYNLRSRKSKLSEEEVATRTPLSNRRTGKRLAESDAGFEVTSKKSYYSRKKTSTLSEEEVSKDSQEGKEIVNEEIKDTRGSLETDTNGFKELRGDMVSEEEKQNVGGGTQDSKENSKVTIAIEETKEELVSIKEEQTVTEEIKDVRESLEAVTNITVEETKEELVSEEEKQNVGEEIQDMIGKLKGTITTEETKEELGIQKGTESTDWKKMQNMEVTLEMSAKACAGNDEGQLGIQRGNVEDPLEIGTKASAVNDEEQLVSEEVKQNVDEEIEDIIENSKVTITTEETKEKLVSEEEKQNVDEEIEDIIENSEVTIATEDTKEELVSEEEKQNVGEEIEDILENSKVTIATEETKEELEIQRGNVEEPLEIGTMASAVNDEGQLVSEEEKENVGEEIEDIMEILKVTIATEETKAELGIQKGTENTGGENLQNMEETLEMSAEACAVSDEWQLEIQRRNVEEPLEIGTKASAVNDEGQFVSEEEKQNVGEEIEDIIENSKVTIATEETKEELEIQRGNVEETFEIGTKASAVNDEGQLVSEEEKQNVDEKIEDMIENSKVTIATEETKEELELQRGNVEEPLEIGTKASAVNDEGQLVSEEEKHVGEEIEDIIETSKVTIATEVTKEELGIQKGIGNNLQNTEETLEMSAEACAVNDERQLVSNKEEQTVAEEIEDVKESLEVVTNITAEETKEELVSHKVNKSLDEEVGNGNMMLVKCARSFLEKSVADLFSTKVKEYINEETTDMQEPSVKVNTEIVDEEANKYLGSQEESKGMDEETEDMNVPCNEVNGQLASHERRAIDKETEDLVESCKVSRSGCTTDSQEKTEDEVISAKETLEASKTACVEAEEDKSFAPIPKTPAATRSRIPKTPVATRSKILFMGNLPYSVDRKTVLSFFEDVGNVVDIRMAKNANGSMKGFCHVTFATAAAAVKALEKNGEIFHNRNVKLDLAENLSNKHVLGSTVLVRGLERSQPEEDIQKSLMKHFGDCGTIQNIHIPKDIEAGDSRRVAFIRFENSDAVSKAVKLCGSELGDSKLFVKEVGRNRFRRKSSNAKRRNSKRQVPSKTNQ